MILQPATLHLLEEVTAIIGLLLVLCLLGGLIETMLKPSEKILGYLLNDTLVSPQPSCA